MRNLKLLIEYDGAEFSGWQQQRGLRTVEGELRRALENLTGRDEVIYGAGRTDAGAHAEGQVAKMRGKQVSPPAPFPQSGVAESLGSSNSYGRNESGLSRDVVRNPSHLRGG